MNDAQKLFLLLISSVTVTWMVSERCVLNLTPSYPEGVYWLSETDRSVGDLVWFDDISGIASHRGYIPDNAKLMKEIVAKEGALFCVGEEFRVGQEWYGRVYSTDSAGRELPIRTGCREVPAGHILVAAQTDKSFDSRYLGPIPKENIHGNLEALWIW